jgi:hypothetical protein
MHGHAYAYPATQFLRRCKVLNLAITENDALQGRYAHCDNNCNMQTNSTANGRAGSCGLQHFMHPRVLCIHYTDSQSQSTGFNSQNTTRCTAQAVHSYRKQPPPPHTHTVQDAPGVGSHTATAGRNCSLNTDITMCSAVSIRLKQHD